MDGIAKNYQESALGKVLKQAPRCERMAAFQKNRDVRDVEAQRAGAQDVVRRSAQDIDISRNQTRCQ